MILVSNDALNTITWVIISPSSYVWCQHLDLAEVRGPIIVLSTKMLPKITDYISGKILGY